MTKDKTENKQTQSCQLTECILLEKMCEGSRDDRYSKGSRDGEISLKDLIFVLIRGKKVILLTALIALLIVAAVSLAIPHIKVGTKGELQTAVQLYFPEIAEGNSPNGQKYDPNEIKSVEVLENAIISAALQNKHISLSQLRANIKFSSVFPEDTARRLEIINNTKDEKKRLEYLETMQINPDAYIVKLNVANNLGISMEEGRRLLDCIIYEYKDWMIKTYGTVPELPNIFTQEFKIEDYDYAQAADILSRQLLNMELYVDDNISRAGIESTAMREFNYIKGMLAGIRTVEIEGLLTKISAFCLTKDPNKAEANYLQMADEKGKTAARKAEEAASLKDIIANYHSNDQKIVLGDAGQTALELKSESSQYNQFVSQYVEAKIAEATALSESEYYSKQAERFASEATTATINSQTVKEIETSINSIKEKLIYLSGEISAASDLYLKDIMYQRYVEQIVPAKVYVQASSINIFLNMAIALAAGLMIGILLVLLREFLKNEE